MSIFACKTAIINLVAMAKFFYVICKAVLLSLFVSEYCDRGLFGLISTYFEIIKTNSCNMLYLYCLIWLKRASHLLTLHTKIQGNEDFCMKLLAFLENIIKCSAKDDASFDTLYHACPNMHEGNNIKNFMVQLKKDSKAVAKKVQMYFPTHNPICYKYNTVNLKSADLISQGLKFSPSI